MLNFWIHMINCHPCHFPYLYRVMHAYVMDDLRTERIIIYLPSPLPLVSSGHVSSSSLGADN